MEKPWFTAKGTSEGLKYCPKPSGNTGTPGKEPTPPPLGTSDHSRKSSPSAPEAPLQCPSRGWLPTGPPNDREQGQEEEPNILIGLPQVDRGWQAKLELNLNLLTPCAGRMGVAGYQSSPSDDPSVGCQEWRSPQGRGEPRAQRTTVTLMPTNPDNAS